ncbi:MAG: BON domain-containing protein [Gammaproteobacteria bacterium]|nr:BON domain-containing protein [Gammaproteobacteria bacterium]
MLKKTILCGALALIGFNPLFADPTTAVTVAAASEADAIDTGITAKINMLYSQSTLIKASAITVTTTNQNVVLTGMVDTDLQYEKAVALAQSVQGVADVNADNLKVNKSVAPMNDLYLTAKVKGIIMKEKLFGDKPVEYWPVSVETKDGVVFLTGVVDTQQQMKNIVSLAQSVTGIKSVNSTITVK